jgi:hypothetical protein
MILALKPAAEQAKEFRNFSLKLIDRREMKRGCVTAEDGKCRLVRDWSTHGVFPAAVVYVWWSFGQPAAPRRPR